MPKEVLFPEIEPRYILDRDCLAFRAVVDGTPIECLVTAELLLTRFGARDMAEDSMRQAYREHRDEILAIIRNHIENGWIDEEGRIFLTTRFTRLNVTFPKRLGEWAASRAVADNAHRVLTEIIGPNAEEVMVEWGGDEPPPGERSISLRILDPSIPYSTRAIFGSTEWQDPTILRLFLARLWSGILRARSRKLLLKSG